MKINKPVPFKIERASDYDAKMAAFKKSPAGSNFDIKSLFPKTKRDALAHLARIAWTEPWASGAEARVEDAERKAIESGALDQSAMWIAFEGRPAIAIVVASAEGGHDDNYFTLTLANGDRWAVSLYPYEFDERPLPHMNASDPRDLPGVFLPRSICDRFRCGDPVTAIGVACPLPKP